jgi:Predicted membrane-associated Zn-dependent proteases 1
MTTVAFFVGAFVIIFVHELGHYLSAKVLGFNIEEFSVGIGFALIKRKFNDTLYVLRLLPLGGFCLIKELDRAYIDDVLSIRKLHIRKILVFLSGSLFNFLFAAIILSFAGNTDGLPVLAVDNNQLLEAGITNEYRLSYINENRVYRARDIAVLLEPDSENILCFWDSDWDDHEVTVRIIGSNISGISFNDTLIDRLNGIFHFFGQMLKIVQNSVRNMVIGNDRLFDDLGNPYSDVVVEDADIHYSYQINLFLIMTGIFSLTVAFFNMLPLIFLDGYKVLCAIFPIIRNRATSNVLSFILAVIGIILTIVFIF